MDDTFTRQTEDGSYTTQAGPAIAKQDFEDASPVTCSGKALD